MASPALDRVAHGRPLIRAGAATQDGDVLFPTCPAEGFVLHKRATQRVHGHSVYGHPHCPNRKPANTPRSAVPTGSPPVWVPRHVQFQCQTHHPFSTWGGGVSCCEPFLQAYKHPWFLPDEKENEDIPQQRGPFPTPATHYAQSLSHARSGQALPVPHVKAPDKVAGDLGAQWTGRQSGLCRSTCDQRASNIASNCFLGSLDTRAQTSPQSPHFTRTHLINLLLNRFSCLGNGPPPLH